MVYATLSCTDEEVRGHFPRSVTSSPQQNTKQNNSASLVLVYAPTTTHFDRIVGSTTSAIGCVSSHSRVILDATKWPAITTPHPHRIMHPAASPRLTSLRPMTLAWELRLVHNVIHYSPSWSTPNDSVNEPSGWAGTVSPRGAERINGRGLRGGAGRYGRTKMRGASV